MSTGPSRARRQLAARLAAQKQLASENAEGEGDSDRPHEAASSDSQWPSNPFVIAGIDDDADGSNSAFPNTDFGSNADAAFASDFHGTGFSPPDSFSNSSDEDGDGHAESIRRGDRVPLEVDEDDDDMGEMVAPSMAGMDSDEEEDAILNESLGYSNLPAPSRFGGFQRPRQVSSHFDDDQNDSSDGEDDGLVEILVPGRKSSTSN